MRAIAIQALTLAVLTACTASDDPSPETATGLHRIRSEPLTAAPAPTVSYHGGPLMLHPTVYLVWYGTWTGNTAPSILADYLSHLGGSPGYAVNTSYTDGSGNRVQNAITLGGIAYDSYSGGKVLSGTAQVAAVIDRAIMKHALPLDQNGIYFVLTSSDVDQVDQDEGFCTAYCGWHTYGTIEGTRLRYGWVGNADRCPYECRAHSPSPNGNPGADAMVSTIDHEIDETVTDPNLDGWYSDATGAEVGDLCSDDYGTQYTTASGAAANTHLGARDYLVQTEWVQSGGCVQSWPGLAVGLSGQGRVTSTPAGIDCPAGTCSEWLPYGTPVTLHASAGSRWAFLNWDGCDSSAGTTCQVTIDSARAVKAVFECVASPDPACYDACLDGCEAGASVCVPSCRYKCGGC
jgi:hypothetical protein